MASPSPSNAMQRPDLGATMEEFDLMVSRQGFVGLALFGSTTQQVVRGATCPVLTVRTGSSS